MAKQRRDYSAAEELALTTQCGGTCPRCGKALFYSKRAGNPRRLRQFRGFELAHIYPLNPTPRELAELDGAALIHDEVNHPDNLIPLCTDCHTQFDKPRTREEYEELVAFKRELIAADLQKELQLQYPLEPAIHLIVQGLHSHEPDEVEVVELRYDPKRLDSKFDETLAKPVRYKIRSAVTGYYSYIRQEFTELERLSPTASDLIFSQVRSFYLQQKKLGLPQGRIFSNVVQWIHDRTNAHTGEAAEFVAAFFVQNCEVFE